MTTAASSSQEWLRQIGRLPSLPPVYQKINTTISDPRNSMNKIAEVISADQGLTLRLLRLANSSFYGFPSKISTIHEAISLIGLQQVRDLALGTSVMDLLKGDFPKLITLNDFWKHSLACGIAARVIGELQRDENLERLFAAGLLHDIGYLVIYLALPGDSQNLLRQSRDSDELVLTLERKMLSLDHAEIGAAILESWELPPTLIHTTRFHHCPFNTVDDRHAASILHVADIVAYALQIGSSGEISVPTIDPRAWDLLGHPVSKLDAIIHEVDCHFREISAILLN